MLVDLKSSQKYTVYVGAKLCNILGVIQRPILDVSLVPLYINNFPGDVICDIAICTMILLSTLRVTRYLICGNN